MIITFGTKSILDIMIAVAAAPSLPFSSTLVIIDINIIIMLIIIVLVFMTLIVMVLFIMVLIILMLIIMVFETLGPPREALDQLEGFVGRCQSSPHLQAGPVEASPAATQTCVSPESV